MAAEAMVNGGLHWRWLCGTEPTAPKGAALTAVAVDGGGGNGVVPATVVDNDSNGGDGVLD